MIKKILLIAVPVIILGLCLFFSVSAYLKYRDDFIEVPVASHQLFQRTQITDEDLTMISVPRAYLPDDVFVEKEDIIGKYVKLSFSLAKGSLIYAGAMEEDIRDLSVSLLKKGEVSYDLYTGEVKINTGNLSVNMYVDIYLSIKSSEKNVSDLLISGCRITGLFDNQGRAIRSYESDARISIVTIAVEADCVSLIDQALMAGSINVLPSSESYDMNRRAQINQDSRVLSCLQ